MWRRIFAVLALLAVAMMPMISAAPAFAAQPISAMHCQGMVGQDEDGRSLPQSGQDVAHRACALACASTCSMILSPPAATRAREPKQGDMVVAPLVAALDDKTLAVEPPPPR
ncbi:MAG: hypothetical protein ABL909_06725 [Sphingopyxis sp.]